MKIKQSFIDRCKNLSIEDIRSIAKMSNETIYNTVGVVFFGAECNYTTEILKATANVLKIDLSDIYEVEPNTLTE